MLIANSASRFNEWVSVLCMQVQNWYLLYFFLKSNCTQDPTGVPKSWPQNTFAAFRSIVMDVSNHPVKINYADEASPWTSWCRINKKSHPRSCPFNLCWLLTAYGSYLKPFLMAEISACRELIFMHKARKHGLVPKFLIPKPLTFLIHCVLIRDIAVIVYSGMWAWVLETSTTRVHFVIVMNVFWKAMLWL